MAAISTRMHEQFMELINNHALLELMDKSFQNDCRKLENLFEQYQQQVAAVHRLIPQYNIVQKRLRSTLRSQQIKQKKAMEISVGTDVSVSRYTR